MRTFTNHNSHPQPNLTRSRLTGLFIVFLLSLMSVLGSRVGAVAASSTLQHAPTTLIEFGSRYPEELISVIVQKTNRLWSAQTLIDQLHGQVTDDLPMISAVAARVPGKALAMLAASPNVAWVSPDLPVGKSDSADGKVTWRETFDGVVYQDRGDAGQWANGASWPGQIWSEIGESDGPNSGDVLIAPFLGGQYIGLRLRGAGKGLQSSINLTDAEDAHLSFSYRRKNFNASSDEIAFEVSVDKGATWTTLGDITGPADDQAIQSIEYDLTPYAKQDILIRFAVGDATSPVSQFYVDNVQVVYTPQAPNHPSIPSATTTHVFMPVLSGGNSAMSMETSNRKLNGEGRMAVPNAVDSVTYVADGFDQDSYCNDDGPASWGNCWVENDPTGSGLVTSTGHVQVFGVASSVRLEDYPDSGGQPSIARSVNLATAASASVHFDFGTNNAVEPSDSIVFEISTDAGATYTTLVDITGISGGVNQHKQIDLTRFTGKNITLRFRVANGYGADNKIFRLLFISVAYDRVGFNSAVLLQSQSNWKYLDDGSDQGTAWRQPGFNDKAWAMGAAALGYGYSSLYASTNVSYGPSASKKYITTYFRRTFNIADVSKVNTLYGYTSIDDGAVVYVNGVEVARYNMPTGTIAATTRANIDVIKSNIGWPWTFFGVPTTTLVNGENTMAVEVHQYSPTSDTLLFDLILNANMSCSDCINTTNVVTFAKSVKADQVWNTPNRIQGQSVAVAVVDSGISVNNDLQTALQSDAVITRVDFVSNTVSIDDINGHGTHVAGIIAGNGSRSRGNYIGIAPKAKLVDVRVLNDLGFGTTSKVVAGLQWIYDNRLAYNIRVVNLSMNSLVTDSYKTSPIDAALEILWFNKVVVVVSAGNNGTSAGPSTLYPPANDPFVITVGAADDKGTTAISDDTVAPFSAYGNTTDGFAKPDLVAPGRNIISLLAADDSNIIVLHQSNVVTSSVGTRFFKMSGTSLASPIVAGAAALLLSSEPNLNPDQVKYRLMATANKTWTGYSLATAGAGYLDVQAAISGTTTSTANTGLSASPLLFSGSTPPVWGSVNWSSVNWSSVNWSSVNWSSVNWSSVNWSSVVWP